MSSTRSSPKVKESFAVLLGINLLETQISSREGCERLIIKVLGSRRGKFNLDRQAILQEYHKTRWGDRSAHI